MYRTEELVSYEETIEVQAFLQARTRAIKQRYRKEFKRIFNKEAPKDFIKAIQRKTKNLE